MSKKNAIPRRAILQGGALSLLSLGLDPLFLTRAAMAVEATGPRPKSLVCLFQRGAVDVLSMVVPHAEASYYDDRPTVAIPRPGEKNGALDLDGKFGLHPKLGALKALFDAKELAIITATGSPDPTRSHFDAQNVMEAGSPAIGTVRDGWLNRCLAEKALGNFGGVAISPMMPASLSGKAPALVIQDLAAFGIRAKQPRVRATLESAFHDLYAGSDLVASTGRDALAAMETVQRMDSASYRPENGAAYPKGALGKKLMQVAQLLKAGLGTRVAFLDCGGWDTHTGQNGRLAPLLTELGLCIAAFRADMGDRMRDTVLLTMSEFGRMVSENGAGGTDHGHGSAMLAIGGGVAGGKVLGKWPGLARDARFEGRDLAVTTDFRDVFAEIATRHLGVKEIATVFPGFTPSNPAKLFA